MIIYEEILKEFQKQGVKYILVGGIAVNLHGYLRATADLDILVEMTDKNLRRVVNILKAHGYHVKQPVDPMQISDKKIREDWIKNKHMKAFNFYKEDEFKEVDIIIKSPMSYNTAKGNIRRIKIDNMILPVIALEDLIKMKIKTGRDLDKIDIKALKTINRSEKRT
jgi:predicted nucleotidyltransferase